MLITIFLPPPPTHPLPGHLDTMHQCRVRCRTNRMMRPGRRVPSRVYASCECSEWFSIQYSSYIFAYIKCSFSCSVAASVNSSPTPRMVATHSRNVPWPRFRKWRSRPRPAAAASRSKCLYSLRAKCIL